MAARLGGHLTLERRGGGEDRSLTHSLCGMPRAAHVNDIIKAG